MNRHITVETITYLPEHVAIIMDGNGRWAERCSSPRLKGHQVGVEAARSAIRCLNEYHIKYVTFYAFSTENWRRPEDEVNGLLVDLLIRTGGELRISNFLLWQAAYAECYFSKVLWPDFDRDEIEKTLLAYIQQRRPAFVTEWQ